MDKSLPERFWEKVDKNEGPTGCWFWTAAEFTNGYGGISVQDTVIGAHRASWLIHYGYLPDDHVLHTCDNKLCVNPEHLYTGDHQDNVDDALDRGQFPIGERNGHAKLTEEDVKNMRQRYRESQDGYETISDDYDVGRKTAQLAIKGKTWKHIE